MRSEELIPKYSIAIRTLGTAGEKFRQELESIARQTIQPERVIVYVAETCGVKFVDGTIGREEYRYVKKGMVAQRALPYDELTSPYLLLLDDDVELAPDTAERLLKSLVEQDVDAMGADCFKDQDMSLGLKTFAILTNWVAPHYDVKWAYKVTRTGAFSYLSKRKIAEIRDAKKCDSGLCLPTQKLDGPCVMWQRSSLLSLHWEDELWMDRLSEFAYGDDLVESYKCFVNGGKLMLNYDAGVNYLNAKTASSVYHHTHKKYYIRSLMSAIIWYRIKLGVRSEEFGVKSSSQVALVTAFVLKCVWLLLVNIIAGVLLLDLRIPIYFVQGLVDAWQFVHSEEYRSIPGYELKLKVNS